MTIEIHSCAVENSTMSFPLGAICIKGAINRCSELGEAVIFSHLTTDDPIEAAISVADRKPSAVGCSEYIWNYLWFEQFSKKIRELLPSVILFAGGPHTVAFEESLLQRFDFAVLGEGEESTVCALKQAFEGLDIDCPGVITRKHLSFENSSSPNLETLPSVFLEKEADVCMTEDGDVLWELTRGCPFACAFCFESRGKRVVRNFPEDRIADELDYFVQKKIKNVFVLDPTFNLDKPRAKRILKTIASHATADMHFTFEVRAELLDAEMAELFSVLDCSLQIGLQSSVPEVLGSINRTFDEKVFSSKVELLNHKGIAFGIDVMIGLPNDNLSNFRRTLNYAVSLTPSNIDIFPLSILPGTELFYKAQEFGIVTSNDIMHTVEGTPTFSASDLEKAFEIRNACDLFYTKGQACMWLHCILQTLEITPCNLFSLFSQWMKQTKRSEDEDVFVLQDDFVTSVFIKTGKKKLLGALKSFMELHQGISYVQECGEDAPLELLYLPDDLAALDKMSLEEFVRTMPKKKCFPVVSLSDGEIRIL